MKQILSWALIAMLFALAGSSVASAATAPKIPSPVVKPDAKARFKLTVQGFQSEATQFFRPPELDNCTLHTAGTLDEDWRFARGKDVTIEFLKYGHKVFMKRAGRRHQLGDTAFATSGTVFRAATGTFDIKNGPDCITLAIASPTCFQKLQAPLDMRVDWSGGKLFLAHSGPAASVPNPAEDCGIVPGSGSSVNELTNPFPFLRKQSGRLSAKTIFGSKKGVRIRLRDDFLQPLYSGGFTTFTDKLHGESTITLERR